jgi:hypothetical protein
MAKKNSRRKAPKGESPNWRKTKPWIVRKAVGSGWVDMSDAPRWWPSTPEAAEKLLQSLPGVKVFGAAKRFRPREPK